MKKVLKNEKGFAIAPILLAIALIGIIAAAIAASSRTASVNTSENISKTAASTIIQQMSNLQAGYSKMLSDALLPSEITWDKTAGTGIFHPSDGGATEQYPPTNALVTTTNQYVYKVNASRNPVVSIRGVGLDANPDYLVSLVDVKQSVCEQINKILFGDTTIPAPATGTSTDWNTPATVINLSGDTAVDKRPSACIRTTDGKFVYYSVIREM